MLTKACTLANCHYALGVTADGNFRQLHHVYSENYDVGPDSNSVNNRTNISDLISKLFQ